MKKLLTLSLVLFGVAVLAGCSKTEQTPTDDVVAPQEVVTPTPAVEPAPAVVEPTPAVEAATGAVATGN